MQTSLPLLRSSAARKYIAPCVSDSHSARLPRLQTSVFTQRHPPKLIPERLISVHSSVTPDGVYDVDKLDVDTLQLDDPFGVVGDVMTSSNLRCAHPEQPLASAASKLDKVTGLAVVDKDTNTVVGVVSIKDINRLKKQGIDLENTPVSTHMSTPPIVVREKARIGEAAALMLAKNIHRLPVVDAENKLIGIVSRTDIFRPLLNPKEDVYQALTVSPDFEGKQQLADALARSMDEDAMSSLDLEDTWQMKYLYDGECDMCNQLMNTLKSKDEGQGRIKFVNIASLTYNPKDNEGVTYEEAMETIHAIKRDGTIITGPDALKALYKTVGWGWIATFMALPVVDKVVELFYKVVAKYRLPLSGAVGTLTAMRRVTLTDEGVEHCVDDEEACEASW